MPSSSAGNALAPFVVFLVFRGQVDQVLLGAWAAFVAATAVATFFEWFRRRNDPPDEPVSPREIWTLTAILAMGSAGYAALMTFMFDAVDADGRLIVTGLALVTLTMGGWMFAALPRVAVICTSVMSIGTMFGLGVVNPGHRLLALLIGLCWLVALSAILGTARTFLTGLIANTEIERQRELVGLLLHDFEESASDWLWETDQNSKMVRVSASLASALAMDREELVGRSFVGVIAGLEAPSEHAETHEVSIANMTSKFEKVEPFSDLTIPIVVSGLNRWWSITAKPLFTAAGALQGWRGVGSDVTLLRQREIEMIRLANVDSLTGIPNRHQFNCELAAHFAATKSTGNSCTLLLLDLDDFKMVNDSLGHAAGDRLLKIVANRLVSAVDEGVLVARVGGDEFVVLVESILSRQEVDDLANKIRSVLAEPLRIDSHDIDVRTSIGVGFAPTDASTAEQLLRVCDMALYASKASGRNTHSFFHTGMDLQAKDKLNLLADLRSGLDRSEYLLHHQPLVDISNGAIVGVEALVRWDHPTRGLVPPDDFIPLTEESGLIVPLGTWIMNQACREAMRLPSHLTMAVNVSARQFTGSDLLQVVSDALRKSGLPSHRLIIEVTESTLMADTTTTQAILHGLRRMGVRIALDDFGTGYSSLSYLRTFPLDKLKIDRSFVSTLGDDGRSGDSVAIAVAIVQLAEALRLETVAEGIETEAQAACLRGIGCTHGQGYLFARPMPIDDVLDVIQASLPALISDVGLASAA